MGDQRLNYIQHLPKAISYLNMIEEGLAESSLDAKIAELIKLRVSQINGCGFCVRYHTQLLRLYGETTERIDMVVVWHEAGCYNDFEQMAFRWAESLTEISHERHIEHELYSQAVNLFGEELLCQLTLTIGMINIWNRFAIAFHTDHAFISQLVEAKRQKMES